MLENCISFQFFVYKPKLKERSKEAVVNVFMIFFTSTTVLISEFTAVKGFALFFLCRQSKSKSNLSSAEFSTIILTCGKASRGRSLKNLTSCDMKISFLGSILHSAPQRLGRRGRTCHAEGTIAKYQIDIKISSLCGG